MTREPSASKTGVIEVFSFNCPICEDAVQAVKEAVSACGCAVVQRPWEKGPREVRASEGGLYPVPSVAARGRIVFHGCPGPEEALLLRREVAATQEATRTNDSARAAARRSDGGVRRGRPLWFTFDGQEVLAYEGEAVAAALLAAGRRVFRQTSRRAEPRGLFCGMGVCFDCLVQVDGRPNVQACVTPVREAMRVETQRGNGTWNGQMPEEVR